MTKINFKTRSRMHDPISNQIERKGLGRALLNKIKAHRLEIKCLRETIGLLLKAMEEQEMELIEYEYRRRNSKTRKSKRNNGRVPKAKTR